MVCWPKKDHSFSTGNILSFQMAKSNIWSILETVVFNIQLYQQFMTVLFQLQLDQQRLMGVLQWISSKLDSLSPGIYSLQWRGITISFGKY